MGFHINVLMGSNNGFHSVVLKSLLVFGQYMKRTEVRII